MAVLGALVCSPVPAVPAQAVLFPETGMEGAVSFWEDIFTRYGKNQILIHDAETVDLVWEVLDVSGDYETDPDTAREQRRVVSEALRRWEETLSGLAGRLREKAPLEPGEQAVVELARKRLGRAPEPGDFAGFAGRLHTQRGIRERFTRGWVLAGRYLPHMAEVFSEAGVPLDILALPLFESSFVLSSRSSKGAVGVWQFIRSTGRIYLGQVNKQLDFRLDPILATRGASRYLLDAHRRLGSWPLAVMSYNHGVGGISRARDEFGTDHVRIMKHYASRLFGYASRNYYPEFLAALRILRNPQQYFPPDVTPHPPWLFTRVELTAKTPVKTVLDRFDVDHETFLAYNPAVLSKSLKLSLPAGYPVRLPPDTVGAAPPVRPPSDLPLRAAPPATALAANGNRAAASPPPTAGPGARPVLTLVSPPPPAHSASRTPTEPATPPPAEPRRPEPGGPGKTRYHIVQPGETVYRISRIYGVKPEQIRRWNALKDFTIQPGQRLAVSPGAGRR
jgi:membrane-bound lytic murein transglycosylase D